MWILLSLVLVLVIATPVSAAGSSNQDPSRIVSGQRIGPAHLGMTQATIAEVNRNSPCPVLAAYDASGRAVRLETNWGGGCLFSDKIQVGLPFEPALQAFGRPDRIAEDARYPHAVAFWMSYQAQGIAFRVLEWPTGTFIQAIAVFPGIAAQIGRGFWPTASEGATGAGGCVSPPRATGASERSPSTGRGPRGAWQSSQG